MKKMAAILLLFCLFASALPSARAANSRDDNLTTKTPVLAGGKTSIDNTETIIEGTSSPNCRISLMDSSDKEIGFYTFTDQEGRFVFFLGAGILFNKSEVYLKAVSVFGNNTAKSAKIAVNNVIGSNIDSFIIKAVIKYNYTGNTKYFYPEATGAILYDPVEYEIKNNAGKVYTKSNTSGSQLLKLNSDAEYGAFYDGAFKQKSLVFPGESYFHYFTVTLKGGNFKDKATITEPITFKIPIIIQSSCKIKFDTVDINSTKITGSVTEMNEFEPCPYQFVVITGLMMGDMTSQTSISFVCYPDLSTKKFSIEIPAGEFGKQSDKNIHCILHFPFNNSERGATATITGTLNTPKSSAPNSKPAQSVSSALNSNASTQNSSSEETGVSDISGVESESDTESDKSINKSSGIAFDKANQTGGNSDKSVGFLKIFLIILIPVVFLGGGGLLLFFFIKRKKSQIDENDSTKL